MAKGIIYVMTTVVPGLIKIGKTGLDNFESRMYNLERHGYSNVVGLRRRFAIEVDDYSEKEMLLDEIFSKSKVPNTELFALDIDLVIQLLSSFDGKQIYPETISKEETFVVATKERAIKSDWGLIPDGYYYLSENKKGFGRVEATMKVEDGVFTVLKDSICAPTKDGWIPESRKNAPIKNNILLDDIICNSPSTAGWIVLGSSNNGWFVWKDVEGNTINLYRT
ncbi:MAG: DUF4357 domain-containing protein [Tissierellia bacterium]|nr:DUF4357 domain-containing protein [Tissierellia bacterium]